MHLCPFLRPTKSPLINPSQSTESYLQTVLVLVPPFVTSVADLSSHEPQDRLYTALSLFLQLFSKAYTNLTTFTNHKIIYIRLHLFPLVPWPLLAISLLLSRSFFSILFPLLSSLSAVNLLLPLKLLFTSFFTLPFASVLSAGDPSTPLKLFFLHFLSFYLALLVVIFLLFS